MFTAVSVRLFDIKVENVVEEDVVLVLNAEFLLKRGNSFMLTGGTFSIAPFGINGAAPLV